MSSVVPGAVNELLRALRKAGATGQVIALLDGDPAAHARFDDPGAVAWLLGALREAGATGQVTTLASRAAAHVSLDDPGAVAWLLNALPLASRYARTRAIAAADDDGCRPAVPEPLPRSPRFRGHAAAPRPRCGQPATTPAPCILDRKPQFGRVADLMPTGGSRLRPRARRCCR
jgi:hypothetical protein